jgi:uncharacterized protein YceK
MATRAIGVALLLASLPSAGCGTVANLANSHPEQGGTTPFGGIRHDLWCLKNAANGQSGFQPLSAPQQCRQTARKAFWGADLPLSAIGDVVTWPYTKTYTYINQPTPVTPVTLAPIYPAMQPLPERPPPPPPLEMLPQPKEAP